MTTYGRKAICILNPCTQADLSSTVNNPAVLSMQHLRWYAAVEALADAIVVLGYVNRNLPNVDPDVFYPSRGPATVMNFMITTSGLNSYAHTYPMPSGNLLVQANLSTSELPGVCESGP